MTLEQRERQGLAKALCRKDFWVQAFQISLKSGSSVYGAAIDADQALREYDQRFESL